MNLDFDFIEINNIERGFNFIEPDNSIAGSAMEEPREEKPAWLSALGPEDLQFLRRFLLASGSLKDLAGEYQVSYPTIRARLDRLIAKVQAAEDPKINDPFVRRLRVLAADGAVSQAVARELLEAHRQSKQGRT